MRKLLRRNPPQQIGTLCTSSGMGGTHLSLCISLYLGNYAKYRVAMVLGDGDVRWLGCDNGAYSAGLNGVRHAGGKGFWQQNSRGFVRDSMVGFTYDGVDFYAMDEGVLYSDLLKMPYDFIVWDLGAALSFDFPSAAGVPAGENSGAAEACRWPGQIRNLSLQEIFRNLDTLYVLGSLKPWCNHRYRRIVAGLRQMNNDISNGIYLGFGLTKEEKRAFEKEFSERIYAVPYIENPFRLRREELEVLNRMPAMPAGGGGGIRFHIC